MVKLTRQQSKISRIHLNNKITIVAQGKGVTMVMATARPQPTTSHESDDADQHNGIKKVILGASFISVDCCLLFIFSSFLKWPHNGHVENGNGYFEPYPMDLAHP
jgi:hypothetical protein